MPFGTPIHIHSNESNGATTLVLTAPAGGVPAGSMILVAVHADNNVSATVSDSAGNTYNLLTQTNPNGNTASRLTTRFVLNSLAIPAGGTITIAFGATVTSAVATALYLAGVRTNVGPTGNATANGSSASPSVSSGTLLDAIAVMFGILGVTGSSAGDTFTQAMDFATPPLRVDHSSNGLGIRGGYFLNPETTAKTYNPTITSRDWTLATTSFRAAFKSGFAVNSNSVFGAGPA